MTKTDSDPLKELAALAPNTSVAPAVGIAAIALNMALKYHDISTVQDGTLYQQYKLEGRNLTTLHLDHVFETAMKMEIFMLGASERLANLLIDTVVEAGEDDPPAPQSEEPAT